MSYFVNPNASISDITGALNYALANLGGSVSSNLASGQISSGGNTIGYLYQYMDVAFATSYDGVTNFSTTSYTNATYFGLRNASTTTVSTNPADYVWYQVAGGFGTTKYLWYNVTGGRNIQFSVQTTAPAGYYVQWINNPINLDIVTSTIGVKNNILIIYQWTNGTVPARPTVTSTYTWATNTFTPVPSGWSTSLPSNTIPGDVLFEIQIPLSVSGSVLTSLLDWTNTSYPIIATSANGITGVTGTRTAVITMYQWAVSPPTLFPTGTSTYTWATGVYTSASTPNGWTITPGASVAGDILYACDAIYADNLTTSTSTITWSTSSAYSVGASGVNGQRTAVAQLYQWASSAPSSYPSGSVTYTWATGTFTFSGSLNGWSITPTSPVSGDILYAIDQIVTDNATSSTTTVTWGSTTEYAIGLAGTNGSAGSNGLSAIYGYLVQNQTLAAPSFTTPTTGASLPSGWSATPPTVSVGYTFWYIFGQYNSSSITINGIAPNTTAWTGPTAASVFEDIVSDNWSVGGVPYVTPTYGNPSTYSSTGYYISRNTGDCYFNNGIFRGDITGASGTFSGALSGATGTFAGSLSAATGTFSGSLSAATGSFSGTVSASTINSSTINSSTINAATINSASTFSGTVSAGTINSSTINSSTINAATINSASTFAGTMNAGTINSSTINASTINSSSTFAGTVSAGTINSSTINSSTINSSTINAATINSASTFAGTVNAGTINSSTINSSTISGGSLNINSKFIVDTSGNTQILSGTSGARLLIQNNVIKVYDSSGTLRVQMGDLTA